jgi:hypothetical protein
MYFNKFRWLVCLIGFLPSISFSQSKKDARIEHLIYAVLENIPDNLYDLPAGVQRVVLYDVESNLPKVYLRSEDLRVELTQKLTKMGLKVVFLPEFETKINLKIKTTDSTIVIDNRKPLSRIKSNPDKFNLICAENNIQGLFNCYLYYDSVNGPKLTMSILHPGSKNLLWMKKIDLSEDVIINRSEFALNFGIGTQKINEITNARNELITKNLLTIPYMVGAKYSQYLNKKRNQQLGLAALVRVVDQTPIEYLDTNLGRLSTVVIPSVGITYKFHFLPKKSVIPNYWMGFQLGLNYFNYNQPFAGMEQLISLNVSPRMQFGFRLEQTFSEFDSYANDLYIVKLDNINYALQVSFTF